jgi:hypothetical protein
VGKGELTAAKINDLGYSTLFVARGLDDLNEAARVEAGAPPTRAPSMSGWLISSRDDPSENFPIVGAGEIYLMNEDGTNLRRLTGNIVGDFFPVLSPDGKNRPRRISKEPDRV